MTPAWSHSGETRRHHSCRGPEMRHVTLAPTATSTAGVGPISGLTVSGAMPRVSYSDTAKPARQPIAMVAEK